MKKKFRDAPVVSDALALADWIILHFGSQASVLAGDVVQTAVNLTVAIGFAYKNRDREARLLEADDLLLRLRILVRMAGTADLMDHRQMLFVLAQTDEIGKQIGGWLQSLK